MPNSGAGLTPEPVGGQAVGDPAQEGGLAAAGVADDDEPRVDQGGVQGLIGTDVQTGGLALAVRPGVIRGPCGGGGAGRLKLDVVVGDGEAVGLGAAGD